MMRSSSAALVSVLVSIWTLAASLPAYADPVDPSRAEAAERFDRALRLVNSGDLSGGLAEFQRAYSLVPSPIALYNVGLVYAALNRSVEAARTLEKALATPDALTPENVVRAQQVLREQEDKIGQVAVSANVKEGVVEVDNVEAAKLPLDHPLDVASGPHVIGVISAGYAPSRHEVLVAGRERVDVQLDLVAIEGLLAHIALHGLVPAADVFVDGERVGKTPLESTVTVAPGTHQVEVRRAGYTPAGRSIALQDGARGDLSLDPIVDKAALGREGGWLAITASETQSVLSVDGTEVGLLTGSVELPAGPHRIHLERGGFLPAERDVDVPVGGTRTVSVVFEPTPETRAQYVSAAESRRTWSWVTLGLGAAIAAGGVVLAVVEQNQLPGAQSTLAAVTASRVRFARGVCDPSQDLSSATMVACNSRLDDATSHVDNLQTTRTVGWVVAGLGGAIFVTGAVLVLTAPDSAQVRREARRPTLRGLARRSADRDGHRLNEHLSGVLTQVPFRGRDGKRRHRGVLGSRARTCAFRQDGWMSCS